MCQHLPKLHTPEMVIIHIKHNNFISISIFLFINVISHFRLKLYLSLKMTKISKLRSHKIFFIVLQKTDYLANNFYYR